MRMVKIYSSFDLKEKKRELLSLLAANEKSHVHLTASSAESDFQVIFFTYREFIQQTGRTQILSLESEEKTFEPFGILSKMVSTNEYGQITKQSLEEAINPRTALLSLSWANSLTGVIQPIWDIVEVCKEKGIKLHLNVNSVIGTLYFRLQDIEADFFTFDGAIISKEAFTPAFGTENPIEQLDLLQSKLVKACEQMDHLCTETARLRDKLECGLQELVPGCQLPFKEAHRLPHIGVINFPWAKADALLFLLYRHGIEASEYGQHGLSIKLDAETTEKEIDRMVEVIAECALKLQTYSERL